MYARISSDNAIDSKIAEHTRQHTPPDSDMASIPLVGTITGPAVKVIIPVLESNLHATDLPDSWAVAAVAFVRTPRVFRVSDPYRAVMETFPEAMVQLPRRSPSLAEEPIFCL